MIEIRPIGEWAGTIDGERYRYAEMDLGSYVWSYAVPVEVADEIARLQRDSEALAVAKEALENISTVADFGDGEELCWCPERWFETDMMTGEHNENHSPECLAARDALSRIRDLQGADAQKEG